MHFKDINPEPLMDPAEYARLTETDADGNYLVHSDARTSQLIDDEFHRRLRFILYLIGVDTGEFQAEADYNTALVAGQFDKLPALYQDKILKSNQAAIVYHHLKPGDTYTSTRLPYSVVMP